MYTGLAKSWIWARDRRRRRGGVERGQVNDLYDIKCKERLIYIYYLFPRN